ncbi:MAG: Intracellular proteinase inhibitor [Lentisphaerae bacterium ADurb.BinA184]|nr:MAG: Intracellular proteinase inhibitor [Lentisphaerae bacterium ADurb.BinA184]
MKTRYLGTLLLGSCLTLQAQTVDLAVREGGDPILPALPDLTVPSLTAETGYAVAHIGNALFSRIFQAALREIEDQAAVRLVVKRALPGVNYAVVQAVPTTPVLAETTTTAIPVRPGEGAAMRPLLEEARRRLMALPYVEYCAFNPADTAVALPGLPNDAAASVLRRYPEIVAGELVVIFNGRRFPYALLTAQFHAGLPEWSGTVPALFTVGESDATNPREDGGGRRLSVSFRDGKAQTTTFFLLTPDLYGATCTIDPDGTVAETDETNNQAATTFTLPGLFLALTLDAPTAAISTDGLASRITGRLTFANLSTEDVPFDRSQAAFTLDGETATVSWLRPDGEPEADPPPSTGPLVPPGGEVVCPFRLEAVPAAGEHVLAVELKPHGLTATAAFLVKPPPATLNLLPLCNAGSLDAVTLAPLPHDPNLQQWLTNEAWAAFADTARLNDVRILGVTHAGEVLDGANPLTGLLPAVQIPLRMPDLTVVLHFADDATRTAPGPDKYIEALRALWFVSDAWIMPTLLLDNNAEAAPLAYGPVLIGVALNRDLEPRPYTRAALPVAAQMTPTPAPEGTADDRSLLPVRPPQPVAVAFQPLDVTADPAAGAVRPDPAGVRIVIPVTRGTQTRAVAFLEPLPALAACEVIVDPDNRIAESDEDDNRCLIGAPTPEPAFTARAWVEKTTAADRNTVVPGLELVVEGTLVNRTAQPLVLVFPSSLQLDFAWRDVYRWSDGRAFLTVITTVEIPAGQSHRWELRTPLAEIWHAATLPGRATPATFAAIVLDVELATTPYRARAAVRFPGIHTDTADNDGNLLPDCWEEDIQALLDAAGHLHQDLKADADTDGDGWSNLLEFLNQTNPADPDNLPPGRTFKLAVQAGWNLLSLPLEADPAQIQALFDNGLIVSAWDWLQEEGMTGRYQPTDSLEPHQPCWILALEAFETELQGVPHFTDRLQVRQGWTLTGAGGPVQLPEAVRNRVQVYRWAAARQEYEVVPLGTLEEGEGYWLSSPDAFDLDLTGVAAP